MVITEQHKLGLYYLGQGDLQGYYIYSNPLYRIPVFLVGLALPWVFHSLECRGFVCDQNAPKTLKARLLWICASVISAAVLVALILVPMTDQPGGSGSSRQAKNWPQVVCSVVMSICRPIWGVALGVITSACNYGYLPLIDAALSHWVWQPLVKLTYGTYLVHCAIIRTLAANRVEYFYYSMTDVLVRAIGYCILSYSASVLLWCLVERPFATLTDAAMPKRQPAQKQDQMLLQGASSCENEWSGVTAAKTTPIPESV